MKEEFSQINKILMVMAHSKKAEAWFVRHSYSLEMLAKMVELGYLIRRQENEDFYYYPTEKSREIW